ncbi:hypothetical protein [Streptomyces chiangmaiensis]|uniref:Uncharacterized protein n=1 Tax=Streptomyces chiangmaiensis TaxID=766497 RepID=A0ABU7FMS1_9ACTN|nr:hypothetical protein [Streptomyces chiangmaiensis]MED7825416.1 hypothetical protein [Streptomyces chiangmaiensis]
MIASGAVAAAALLIPVAASGTAWAHGEESDESAVLVEQAVALIANNAYEDQVSERIDNALMAPHKEGVDLAEVRQAQDVIEQPGYSAGVSRQVKGLLLDSLGGKLPSAPKAGRPATGDETGTSVVLDEFRPARGISDGGDAVLLGLGVAAIAGGLWLSRRLRPPHTLRELEHRDRRHREAS